MARHPTNTNGITWTVAQDWSAHNKFGSTPEEPNLYYVVAVWVRSATTQADIAEASGNMAFPIRSIR